jgi:8-oxo-dGTP pyrophosphatase MutT (NUDIX family)
MDHPSETHDFNDFVNRLGLRLTLEMPGNTAHLKMASRVRLEALRNSYDQSKAKLSSVLILLYQKDEQIKIALMKRQDYNGVHSGQVSFPGGRREDVDSSFEETALRESNEELGILSEDVNIIGKLSDIFIPPSNFLVKPFIGYLNYTPKFILEESEVAAVIEANLVDLFNEELKGERQLNVRGTPIMAPFYNLNGYVVWGATAMILSELSDIIESMNLHK